MTEYTFTVPVAQVLSPNEHLHWAAKRKVTTVARAMTNAWASAARAAAYIARATDGDRRGVVITLVRGKGQRLLDMDNCAAALKPVLDGLVDAGWLYDDRASHLRSYRVRQEKDNKRGPCVIVTVTVP